MTISTHHIHAFQDNDGEYRTPALAVLSYSFIDAFAAATSWSKLQEELSTLTAMLKKQGETDIDTTVLIGVILRQSAGLLDDETLSLFAPVEMQQLYRPKHYATDPKQTVVWVKAPSPDYQIRSTPYAMLCDKVDRRRKHIVYHDSADAAATAAIAQAKASPQKAFPFTGAEQTYTGIFGTNPDFMHRYLCLDKVLTYTQREQLERAHEAFMDERYQDYEANLKTEILQRSQLDKYGWTELKHDEQVIATVPTLPLMCWAFKDELGGNMPFYQPVSPPHFKLSMDCRYHTDWLIGGNLSLDTDYWDDRLRQASNDWARDWQRKHLGVDHHVLSVGKAATGRIRHATLDNASSIEPGDILILPDSSPKYQLHVDQACRHGGGAVITEIGSQAMHMAKVGRERQITVFRIDKARSTFPEGLMVSLEPTHGRVNIVEHP